ncbi:hypothetical protein Poly41_60110 [Novipirellula artificiosorum]|uniref:Uncharacterized protein n=2 Tax=Novipirellula artificiosorum TaxID=2528016 RepID=A0A5C6D988_9BACT|nr:hypothetical protein Poly41_60110 [Novipirellula artificiosorum]
MKAIEKDRDRRYESASAFAADVQRYLAGEAVEACPPSTVYRLRKFARRNRVSLMTASLIAFAMLIGTGVSVWQANRAVAAEQVANQERATAERNLETALDAIEQLLAHVGNPELADIPKVQDIRAEILHVRFRGNQHRFASTMGYGIEPLCGMEHRIASTRRCRIEPRRGNRPWNSLRQRRCIPQPTLRDAVKPQSAPWVTARVTPQNLKGFYK